MSMNQYITFYILDFKLALKLNVVCAKKKKINKTSLFYISFECCGVYSSKKRSCDSEVLMQFNECMQQRWEIYRNTNISVIYTSKILKLKLFTYSIQEDNYIVLT